MRHLGILPDQLMAQRFSDFLLTLGIEVTIDQGAGGWSVWVGDEDQLAQAQVLLGQYLRDPEDPRYRAAGGTAQQLRAQQAVRSRRLAEKFIDVRTAPARMALRPRPVTTTLILISLLVAATSLFGMRQEALQSLWITTVPLNALTSPWQMLPEVRSGEVWRLITPMFIHFGLMHLVFNMLWLWDLGNVIESRRGSWVMAVLVLVTQIPSGILQYVFSGPAFGGMSGVVYGLLAYAWLKGRLQPRQGIAINETTAYIMLAWLGLGFTGILGPIANVAHLVGLAMGALFAGAVAIISRNRG